MNLKVDGSPAAVMHRGFFNPNSTITAKFTTTTPFCYLLLCDEQYDTREMQDRAIIYYRDLGEIPDKENTYSRVQYSVYVFITIEQPKLIRNIRV